MRDMRAFLLVSLLSQPRTVQAPWISKNGARNMNLAKKSKRPIAIDLFAGAGGLSLGFEQAGFDVIAAVEIDPVHAAVHKMNFPECHVICGDVGALTGDTIRERVGLRRESIDVVFGGPPCQGFSLIGHRVLEDPRNSLVFHFLRLVLELKPKAFVMENVPGMITGRHTRLLDEFVQRFQEGGYRVGIPYLTLNAGHFGVPQDRERLFVFGARHGTKVPTYPEPITRLRRYRQGRQSDLPLNGNLPLCPSVADAIADLPDIEDYDELNDSDQIRCVLKGGSVYARILRGDMEDPADMSYRRERDARLLTGCRRAAHTEESRRRFKAAEPGSTEPVSRFFKLAMDGTCHTLRAGTASDRGAFSAPRPIHPLHDRCISVREAARLHSYPDWFRFHRTIWHGFRQIGNSVPPLLGRAVGSAVIRALNVRPKKPRQTLRIEREEFSAFNMRQAAAQFGVSPGTIAPRKRGAGTIGRRNGQSRSVQSNH